MSAGRRFHDYPSTDRNKGREAVSILSKLMSAIRGGGEPKIIVAPAGAVEQAYAVPTVKFDPARVTEAVKVDLKKNIRKIKEFDESNFDKIYEAALRSISRG
jgi:hypothetical protein